MSEKKYIRFINSDYETLFHIPDGGRIRITYPDREPAERVCRFIDEYHTAVGSNRYHICEFAQQMKQDHSTVIPLRSSLPESCFSFLDDTGEMILIERGATEYRRTGLWVQGGYTPQEGAAAFNEMVGTTRAQEAAMKAGAFSGWASPAADPKNYDEQGQPIKPRNRDRGDAR